MINVLKTRKNIGDGKSIIINPKRQLVVTFPDPKNLFGSDGNKVSLGKIKQIFPTQDYGIEMDTWCSVLPSEISPMKHLILSKHPIWT